MSRRRLLAALLALAPAACGRRGQLRLPREQDGDAGAAPNPATPPEPPAPQRRSPAPIGLETG